MTDLSNGFVTSSFFGLSNQFPARKIFIFPNLLNILFRHGHSSGSYHLNHQHRTISWQNQHHLTSAYAPDHKVTALENVAKKLPRPKPLSAIDPGHPRRPANSDAPWPAPVRSPYRGSGQSDYRDRRSPTKLLLGPKGSTSKPTGHSPEPEPRQSAD